METQFAKIVSTEKGAAILIDGAVIRIVGPISKKENMKLVEKIVGLLRRDGAESGVVSMKDMFKSYVAAEAMGVTASQN